jgi:hypothetical protein
MSKKKKHPGEKHLGRWLHEGIAGNVESQIKFTNFYRNAWNKLSYEPGSTMIHEKDYQPMKCCLCGKDMPSIHDTHNARPLAPSVTAKEALEQNLPHRCCSECCAERVVPERFNDPSSNPNAPCMFTDFFNDHFSRESLMKGYSTPYRGF